MVFKSIEDFQTYIMGKCRNAIVNAQEESRQDIVRQAETFYAGYTPVPPERNGYERTYQLKSDNFIQKMPIESSSNSCKTKVRLDASSLSYTTGLEPSGEQVVSAAVEGGHGATGLRVMQGDGTKLWDESLQEKAKDNVVRALRAQGLPIK